MGIRENVTSINQKNVSEENMQNVQKYFYNCKYVIKFKISLTNKMFYTGLILTKLEIFCVSTCDHKVTLTVTLRFKTAYDSFLYTNTVATK